MHTIGVIEIGSASIRMIVGQINAQGQLEILDKPELPIALGVDVFKTGAIGNETTEKCIQALTKFKTVFLENKPLRQELDSLLVVATTAVREALNRENFLDRIFVATGFTIRVLHAHDTGRCMFLSLLPFMQSRLFLSENTILCVEMGAGGTNVLAVRQKQVLFFQSHNFGAMRLAHQDEGLGVETVLDRAVVDTRVQRVVEQILQPLQPLPENVEILLAGGLIRAALRFELQAQTKNGLLAVKSSDLKQFWQKTRKLSSGQLQQKFQCSDQIAETLPSALATYATLATQLGRQEVLVTNRGMREGLLAELFGGDDNYPIFYDQIIAAALNLGRRYNFDENHALLTRKLARMIAESLAPQHSFDPMALQILDVAALLHEIGLFVSNRDHHLHSQYLINNSDLFGLGEEARTLAAWIAKYHRHAPPSADDHDFNRQTREDRILAIKLIAILRLADCFDRTHTGKSMPMKIARQGRQLIFSIPDARDLRLEKYSVAHKGAFFSELYGLEVVLRQ